MVVVVILCMATTVLAAAPAEVERKNINGTEYLVKTYILPPDGDPAVLIEEDFELDGFSFTHQTTVSEENTTIDAKLVNETRTAETEGKQLEVVLKKFPSTIAYDADGYRGSLALDTGSISTEATGYTTSTRTISTTQAYPSLMYQDPSMIPQTAIKDGVTLSLTDVSWAVTGTSLAGDSLVPTEFTATAMYTKKVSSQVATGYTSTASYTGEVRKENVTGVVHTLTYLGTLVPAPALDPNAKSDTAPWGRIIAGIALLLAMGGGVVVFLYVRAQQGVAIYNLIEDDYLCIGRQRLTLKQPVIDLNEFADVAQSQFYSFVLDKSVTRKLFGRNLTVTLGDITMPHRVKDMDGKYRFNLEMGVGI